MQTDSRRSLFNSHSYAKFREIYRAKNFHEAKGNRAYLAVDDAN